MSLQTTYWVPICLGGNLPYIQITSKVLPYIRFPYKRSVVQTFLIPLTPVLVHQIHALRAPLERELLLPVGAAVPLLADAEGHLHHARPAAATAAAQRPGDGALAARQAQGEREQRSRPGTVSCGKCNNKIS